MSFSVPLVTADALIIHSYTYDLTWTLQHNLTRPVLVDTGKWAFNDRYAWNYHLLTGPFTSPASSSSRSGGANDDKNTVMIPAENEKPTGAPIDHSASKVKPEVNVKAYWTIPLIYGHVDQAST
jgi:hypothetical protein